MVIEDFALDVRLLLAAPDAADKLDGIGLPSSASKVWSGFTGGKLPFRAMKGRGTHTVQDDGRVEV